MSTKEKTRQELLLEIEELRARLEEAEETLRAIRSGEVDALVVSGSQGEQVFTLKGVDYTYRVLVEEIKEGAVTLAADGTILYCNSRFAEMLKTPIEQVIGSSIHRFVASADQPMLEALLQEASQGRGRGELNLRAGDGTSVPVILSINDLQLDGIPGLCIVVTDLTEQKRAEEIVASERLAQSILGQAAEVIVVCDENGRIIRASQMAHQLCSQNPLLQPFDAVFPLRVVSEQVEPSGEKTSDGGPFSLATVLRGERLRGIETLLTGQDGQLISLLLSAGPLLGERDGIRGCVVTLTNITERKQAEEALKEYSEGLEEMVKERTQELWETQEQLVRQEKLAVLGQLAGGVGHELRHPLGVISNVVYLLQLTLSDADETIKEHLDMISAEVNDAKKTISDLLGFSRDRPVEREEVAVSELVAQVLRKQPAPTQVKVINKVTSDLPSVFVDGQQIMQVLVNLVSNAYQAMPEGGELTITAQAERGWVHLSVTDTGGGISKENMKKLFEPLFTTKARGIGLGLVVSRTLVEANGGSIEVESEEGKGSTFTVILPTREVMS